MIPGLITLDCEQGSEEWLRARLGIPTATGLKNIVTNSGKKSEGWTKYLGELVEEHTLGLLQSGVKSDFMARGTELEPQARMAYEFEKDCDVVQVGGVYRNADKDLMISPDGLIPSQRKGLEIKCPKMSNHIRYILEGVVPTEYVIQVQAALWVTGYDSWDFVSYCPEYQKQPFFLLTVHPDKKIFAGFEKHIPPFLTALKVYKQTV